MSSAFNGANRAPIHLIVASKNDANKRLDKFLCERFPEKSRSQIQKMIERQKILVEGRAVKASYKIRGEERVEIAHSEPTQSAVAAEPIPLGIVYQDNDLAVINKPAGMVVHRGAGANSGTMVNALLYYFQELSQWGGVERPGIVHRLDKQTSGLMVIAKNDFSHQKLSRQFQSRQVTKKYIALVHGSFEVDSGEIKSPIGRDRLHRIKMTTRARHSREAHTHYQVLEKFQKFTLLELDIKTGRTHQIRVHLSSINHPIVGDTLYGAPSRTILDGTQSLLPPLNRNFLHATSLEFAHPRTQELLKFSSDLPERLKLFLQQLRCSNRSI